MRRSVILLVVAGVSSAACFNAPGKGSSSSGSSAATTAATTKSSGPTASVTGASNSASSGSTIIASTKGTQSSATGSNATNTTGVGPGSTATTATITVSATTRASSSGSGSLATLSSSTGIVTDGTLATSSTGTSTGSRGTSASSSASLGTSLGTTTSKTTTATVSTVGTTGSSGGLQCTCPKTACGKKCVNTENDVSNCGGCGIVCTPPECGGVAVCLDGTCQPNPPQNCFTAGANSGTTGAAANNTGGTGGTGPQSAAAVSAFGATGGQATAGSSTTGGTGGTGSTAASCNNACTTTQDCASGYTCVAPSFNGFAATGTGGAPTSTCQPCTAPNIICDGACIQANDATNCGACGNACGPYSACTSGQCTCKPSNACGQGCSCETNQTLCDTVCADTNSDPLNCGGCNRPCASFQSCVGGSCLPPDAGGHGTVFALTTLNPQDPTNDSTGLTAVADINGDGKPDLIGVDYSRGGKTFAFLNQGSGTFGSAVLSPSPVAYANGLVVGDFITGGHGDLVATVSGSAVIHFMPGQGTGAFGTVKNETIKCYPGVMNLAAGNVMGTANLDLVVSCDPPNDLSSDHVAVLPGNGDGTFGAPVFSALIPIGIVGLPLFLADLNGDGKPDLLTSTVVALNEGGGKFSAPSSVSAGQIAAIGDFNEDGKVDLVVTGQATTAAGCPANPITLLLGNGDGTFTTGPSYSLPAPVSNVVVGDFDGDGHQDVAAMEALYNDTSVQYFAVVYFGTGAGTLQVDTQQYPLTAGTNYPPASGDLAGNGKTDIAIYSSFSSLTKSPEELELLMAQ